MYRMFKTVANYVSDKALMSSLQMLVMKSKSPIMHEDCIKERNKRTSYGVISPRMSSDLNSLLHVFCPLSVVGLNLCLPEGCLMHLLVSMSMCVYPYGVCFMNCV